MEHNVGSHHSHGDDNGAGIPDTFGLTRRGPGNAASDILGDIFKSIMDGPPRLGHPANPRFDRGRRLSSLDDFDDDIFGGSPFGRPSGDPLDMLGEMLGGDEALDELFGAKITVTAIGPEGVHRVGTFDGKPSDWRALTEGRDALGIAAALKAFEENPPSRNQRKLSMLSMLDKGMPLTLKVYSYAGHAGAEIARFLRDPEANKDFAFITHLAGILKAAHTDDKEAFANIKKRFKEYNIDFVGLIAKIQAFVDKPSVNSAKSVQMRLAMAAPVALGLLDDVSDDLKETRESFEEKLRRTARI